MEQENQTPIDKAPSPTPPPNPPIHKKISALLFLKIGIAEVLFVLFGLILIFGTLNYFNVFRISSSIPLLSFLPTKGEQKENKTIATNEAAPQAEYDPTSAEESEKRDKLNEAFLKSQDTSSNAGTLDDEFIKIKDSSNSIAE